MPQLMILRMHITVAIKTHSFQCSNAGRAKFNPQVGHIIRLRARLRAGKEGGGFAVTKTPLFTNKTLCYAYG